MNGLVIREARPEDDPVVGELLVNAYLTRYAQKMPEVRLPPERLDDLRDVARKRASGTVLVLERDGEVVGTVTMYRPGHDESEAWLPRAANLRYFALDVRFQGRGLSTPLLEETERLAKSWGCDAICLHVRRGAVGVARTYARRGYTRAPEADLEFPSVSLEGYVLRWPSS